MPIKASAKKELRKAHKRQVLNLQRAKAVKDTTKKIKKMITAGQKEEAKN